MIVTTGFFLEACAAGLWVLSPGILGSSLGVLLARVAGSRNAGLWHLHFAAGGILGYLALAIYIQALDKIGQRVFDSLPQLSLIGLTGILVFFAIKSRRINTLVAIAGTQKTSASFAYAGIVGGLAGLLVLVLLYSVSHTPVMAWDALDMWVYRAKYFLLFDTTEWALDGFSRAEGDSFPWAHGRHPMTIIYLAAFSGYTTEGTEVLRGTLLPWIYVWICGAVAIYGLCREFGLSYGVTLLSVYAYLSTPLLEAHAYLVGYADLWVTVSVVTAAAMLAVGINHSSTYFKVAGIVMSFAPMAMKNTGVLYSISLILPLMLVSISAKFPRALLLSTLLLFITATVLIAVGFDVEFAGKRYALIYGVDAAVAFGGYEWPLILYSPIEVALNKLEAVFVNHSFSIIGLLVLIVVANFASKIHGVSTPLHDSQKYLILVVLIGAFVISAPELLAVYSEQYAEAGSDTGASRFLMAFMLVGLLSVVPTAKLFELRRNPNF